MKNSYLQGKRALFILLVCLMGMAKAMAQSFTVGDLNYTVNENGTTVTVTGHVYGTAATGPLVIPESVIYEGSSYAVTAIGDFAFSYCTGFTGSLIIPNSVTTIGIWAFTDCINLTGSLTIGHSVTMIGDYAFGGCSGFTGSLVIPDSVTTIGESAFGGCSGFTGNLTFGAYVTFIGWSAFNSCTGFTGNLVIPNSVAVIDCVAFNGCSGFTGSLTIGNSMTSIGSGAFSGCSGFSEVYYNATNCGDASSIETPFVGCGGSLIIGDNVERIPAHMFENGGFTGTLTIPNSVTEIGRNAFMNCSGFTGNLVIPESIITITDGSFYGCSGFSGNLIISENVTTIGGSSFSGCSGFGGDLVIPSTVTAIGSEAFTGCSGFSEVFYNATNCANASHFSTFSGCGGTLTIGENVERIPDFLFMNAAFSGDLIIPGSVTSLGGNAFQDCIGLTSLTIGDSLAEIGTFAFAGCSNFSFITSYAVQPPTQVPYGAFQDVPKDIPVYVPCDLVDEYQSAMYWDEFTNYVEALPYHLTVEAIEPENCTVSIVQHPSCEESQGIVKAEPADGYVFVAWEEEGTVVSTNAVYTFTLDRDIHLVARVKSNTSVSEGSDESIAVYPNPTCGKVCIKAKDIKNVGVYNLLGQNLFECAISGSEFSYDFSEHGAGLYLIRIETSSGIAVKKVSVR